MKELHKKTIFILIGISFMCSLLSDLIYGKIILAQEYATGQFISQISSLSMSFAFVLIMFYLILRICLKDFFDKMFQMPYQNLKEEVESQEKKNE